ncbi:phosphoglucosamine mutase [Striga asiatica]|uniref:Phosphoglucosamine mutase n=1 Tax=Striga asiatica TaxID=4170 RepID=A0A5A7QUD2_STRAF|nr:phosphoglucosamine mutase [Striga asiatica]
MLASRIPENLGIVRTAAEMEERGVVSGGREVEDGDREGSRCVKTAENIGIVLGARGEGGSTRVPVAGEKAVVDELIRSEGSNIGGRCEAPLEMLTFNTSIQMNGMQEAVQWRSAFSDESGEKHSGAIASVAAARLPDQILKSGAESHVLTIPKNLCIVKFAKELVGPIVEREIEDKQRKGRRGRRRLIAAENLNILVEAWGERGWGQTTQLLFCPENAVVR